MITAVPFSNDLILQPYSSPKRILSRLFVFHKPIEVPGFLSISMVLFMVSSRSFVITLPLSETVIS